MAFWLPSPSRLRTCAFFVLVLCACIEVSSEVSPGLRADDGDPNVGGAGRDTTCPVPAEEGSKPVAQASTAKQWREVQYEEDMEGLYLEDDYEEIIKNATELHNPECMYWVGRFFESGLEGDDGKELIPIDINQAGGFYASAAEAGHAQGACALGTLYSQHNDPDKAADFYIKAIELGDTHAISLLAQLYEEAGHIEEAFSLFTQAAERGDAVGLRKMGMAFAEGKGVDKDYEMAAKMFKLAIEKGDAGGHTGLARLHEAGHLGGPDMEKAAEHYIKGAEGGDSESVKSASRHYRHGLGVQKSCPAADNLEQTIGVSVKDMRDEAKARAAEEKRQANAAGVLMGGRPSRYEYIPLMNRPATKEEVELEEAKGWDGFDMFMDDITRWRYTGGEEYFEKTGVMWKPIESRLNMREAFEAAKAQASV